MPLVRGNRTDDSSAARAAGWFTLIAFAAGLAYYIVLFAVAR